MDDQRTKKVEPRQPLPSRFKRSEGQELWKWLFGGAVVLAILWQRF